MKFEYAKSIGYKKHSDDSIPRLGKSCREHWVLFLR